MSGDPALQHRPESMRWYTRALKIPRLIGKLPSGERIKGGPYRQSQLVTAGSIVLVGQQTMRWWGAWGFFGNWGLLLAVAAVGGIAAKYVPTGTVSPLLLAVGAVRLAGRSRTGVWQGRRVAPRRGPTRVATRVLLNQAPPHPVADTSAAHAAAIPPPAPTTSASDVAAVEAKLTALLGARS